MENHSTYTVQNIEGEKCHLGKELWKASPVLRTQPIEGPPYFTVDAEVETLDALVETHRGQWCPSSPEDLMDVISIAEQLRLEAVQEKCLYKLLQNEKYLQEPFLPEYPADARALAFKRLLKGPPRTEGLYDDVVRKYEKSDARARQEMGNVTRDLAERTSHFESLGLERIPIPYSVPIAPAALINRGGEVCTAVFYENCWQPVNLFGRFVDLKRLTISDFYLEYGRYLLYKSYSDVFKKNLEDDSPAEKVLAKCTQFVARERFVFAIETHRNPLKSTILMWNHDSTFVPLHTSLECEISFIDFACSRELLIFQHDPETIVVSRIGRESLHPVKSIDIGACSLNTAVVHDDTLSIFCNKNKLTVVRKCVSLANGAFKKHVDRICRAEDFDGICLLSRGGKLFEKSLRGLRVNKDKDYLQTLGPSECRALSEARLSF